MRCGLLGEKLSHSYSPQIHRLLADYEYPLYEIPPEAIGAFLRSDCFDAINVTIPYKKSVIPYCAELSAQAKRLGAVNTIIKKADGRLIGHNTDYFGFSAMVRRTGVNPIGKKALVLGSGGAGVTARAVLEDMGANVITISRSGKNNYENISLHQDASILVNATPVGMYPNNGVSPIRLDTLTNLECVLDLIYNPARTKLLLDAEKRGIIAENGLYMLVAQAKESYEWFTGFLCNDDVIAPIVGALKAQMENIILIGMPGCGKSTLGKLLAQKLGKDFVDADTCITEKAGMAIPDIFSSLGESGFRKLEAEVLRDLGKKSGLVIATGGGCVTKSENYESLHQNGTILWIQRSTNALPTDGRPLSQTNSLEKLYHARAPLYSAFADKTVNNDASVEDGLNALTEALKEHT